MKERSSSFIFGFVREKEPLVFWAVCCAFLLQGCMGEELDVWKCWDSLWLLPFALFKSSI